MPSHSVKTLSAGDRVRQSGVYLAVHRDHRAPHEIVAIAGERFPRCNHCGNSVRFELLHPAAHLASDHDFAEAKRKKRSQS